jgi:hypothetical protein
MSKYPGFTLPKLRQICHFVAAGGEIPQMVLAKNGDLGNLREKPGFLLTSRLSSKRNHFSSEIWLTQKKPGFLASNGAFHALWVFLFLTLLFPPLPLLAQTPQENLTEVMQTANEQYQAGRFIEATKNYEVIVEAGVQHSNVYYNLANAYFKQGDLGYAILNYRRAQRLDPRDADIAANLAIARAQTIDQIEAAGLNEFNFGQILGGFAWFTLGEIALLLLAFWLFACLTICLYILQPQFRQVWNWLLAGWLLLLVLGGVAIGSSFYNGWRYPAAVVVAPEIEVITNPDTLEESTVEFTLHAGAEVNILDRRLGWRQIALPGDLRGWVPNDAIGLVMAQDE